VVHRLGFVNTYFTNVESVFGPRGTYTAFKLELVADLFDDFLRCIGMQLDERLYRKFVKVSQVLALEVTSRVLNDIIHAFELQVLTVKGLFLQVLFEFCGHHVLYVLSSNLEHRADAVSPHGVLGDHWLLTEHALFSNPLPTGHGE